MRKLNIGVWVLAFGMLFFANTHAQYNTVNLTTNPGIEIPSELVKPVFHEGLMDTLISKLNFDIEVYIEDEKGRKGASPREVGQGKYRSTLKGKNGSILNGIGIDTTRFRDTGKPISLVIFVPSKKGEQGQTDQLRGVTTMFSDHFNPTSVSTKILPGNRGIEIRFFFKEGVSRLSNDHKGEHIIGEDGRKNHFTGHVCDPDQPIC